MSVIHLNPLGQEIFEARYAYPGEKSWSDRARVIASVVASAEKDEDKARIENRFYEVLSTGDFIPGGRIIFGAGRNGNRHNLLNCYVIIPEDSVESIGQTVADMYKISCAGGGVGFNVSKIRPKGDNIGSVANSAPGAVSVLKMINEVGEHVRAGKNRRTALMGILNVTHPDLMDFLHVKLDQKQLNNFNISVAVTDKFMEAVELGTPWVFSYNNKAYHTYELFRYNKAGELEGTVRVPGLSPDDALARATNFYKVDWNDVFTFSKQNDFTAKEIWDLIWKNSVESGDPGIYNIDLANRYTNVSYFEKLDSTNPCIVGSTLISVADGRGQVSIEQLTVEGVDVPVNSVNLYTGETEVKMGRSPRKTGNKEVCTITMDDGSTLKCTPDHKLLLLNSSDYVEAKDSVGKLLYKSCCDLHVGPMIRPLISAKVESIEYHPPEDVYNITVDDNHNYKVVTLVDKKSGEAHTEICVKNCGEISLPSYGNCCLGNINLSHMVLEDNTDVNWKRLAKTIRAGVRFLDDVLTINAFPVPECKTVGERSRRIGLGVTGLHYMLIKLNIKYGSDKCMEFLDRLFATIRDEAYIQSVYLARQKTSFPAFDAGKYLKEEFSRTLPARIRMLIKKHGIRNAVMLTIPPCGTISMLMGTSTGIEPIFSAMYNRRYRSNNVWKEQLVVDPLFEKYCKEGKDLSNFVGAYDVTPDEHAKVQATIQRYIDSCISKTINLPETATAGELNDIILGYSQYLKGITVYRAGSKGNEPLQAIALTEENIKKYMGETATVVSNVASGDVCSISGGNC